ncbi:hypothetical protein [Arthrobacter crystallopoietes]|nr:hypothetical protein [Arthrobacter crystallopoietes]
MKKPQGIRRIAAAAAVCVMLLGSACTAPPQLGAGAAERMQAHAAEVRSAAAAGDYEKAIEGLGDLTEELRQAAGDGDVSFARYQSIEAAIEQLSAGLAAELAAASPTSEPPKPETEAAAPEAPNSVGNTQPIQGQPVPPAPAPVPAPPPTVSAPEPSETSPASPAPAESATAEPDSDQGDGNGQQDTALPGRGNSDQQKDDGAGRDDAEGPDDSTGRDGSEDDENNGGAGGGPGPDQDKDNSGKDDN